MSIGNFPEMYSQTILPSRGSLSREMWRTSLLLLHGAWARHYHTPPPPLALIPSAASPMSSCAESAARLGARGHKATWPD